MKFCAICTIERCMFGNQIFWHRSNIAADPGCVRLIFSSTVWRSFVGITIRSWISKQSSRTCNLFRVLCQYFPYEIFVAFQSRFLKKLSCCCMFLSLLVANAMNYTPRTFCNFPLKKRRVLIHLCIFPWFKVATIPSVINSWLAFSYVLWFVKVEGSMLSCSPPWLHYVGSMRLTQYLHTS